MTTSKKQRSHPLTEAERQQKFQPQPALKKDVEIAISYPHLVAGAETSQVNLESHQVDALTVQYDEPTENNQIAASPKSLSLDLIVKVSSPGVRVFPSSVPATAIDLTDSLRAELQQQTSETLEGYLPEHLPFHPMPDPLEASLKRHTRKTASRKLAKGDMQPTTIFGVDDRRVFSDTSYPWGTAGRVTTAGGVASGVMVGPRHLLTVSHTITWNPDGSTGWLNFTPAYFDGSQPFGSANAVKTYYYRKVSGPTIDEAEQREDFVVVALDQRIGDRSGWMGSKSYTDAWDGSAAWSHIGYPADINSTQRPIYQGSIALDGASSQDDSHERIDHLGDVFPGQSGGPFFSWWSGDRTPYVVAVQSGQSPSVNSASGGSYIVNLIKLALTEFP